VLPRTQLYATQSRFGIDSRIRASIQIGCIMRRVERYHIQAGIRRLPAQSGS
jgi:hypothetical protein